MKKKGMKRLSLNRETLHKLTDEQLQDAEAGRETGPMVCCSTCTASYSCPPPPTGNNEASCLC
ncbi:MAG TPA: class I lanthipeptide [Thermoanaerobaculia bacterium]|jgi:hypothetical protein